jgi:hypothetical protein
MAEAAELTLKLLKLGLAEQFVHCLDRVGRGSSRSIAIDIGLEVRLEDRLDHEFDSGLYHPIPNGRHSHIELHFDPVSLWARLRSPIRFIRFAVTSLLF